MNLPTPIRTSLKRKIFLRFTILVGLAIAATGTLSVMTVRSLVKEEVMEDLVLLAQEGGRKMERIVSTHKSLVRMMALDRAVQGGIVSSTELRMHLQKQKEIFPDVENILIIAPDGIVSTASDSRLEGKDLSSIEQIIEGGNGVYHGPLHLLRAKKTYLISAPIRNDQGILKGILLVELKTDSLYRAPSGEAAIGDSGAYLLLEDSHGDRCANPSHLVLSKRSFLDEALEEESDTSGFSEKFGTTSPVCKRASAGNEGIIESKNENGVAVVAAHHRLPAIGISVLAIVNENEIWEPVRLLLTMLAGATCILLLLVTLIALRLAHDVVQPILHLQKSLKHINAGHLSHKPTIKTGDELEVLDVETAKLSDRLNEAYSSLEKRVEERTRELAAEHAKDEALIESIGEGFLAINLDGKIITANHAVEDMIKLEHSQIVGAHFGSILHLKDKKDVPIPPDQHIIHRAIEEKVKMRTLPSEILTCEQKDGGSFPISITATPFLLGMEIQGVVVTMRDITEEKRIDRMKSEFISLASHQLRTPLTAIGWYIELLQSEEIELTNDQKEYMEQILHSHQRMVVLVNSLLNVSRIELGRVKIEPKEMTIDELVNLPIQNLQHEMDSKKLQFKKKLPDGSLSVDPDLVQLVVENLLSNAVKYTPDGGVVELNVMGDKDEIRFSVTDTGMGIPHAQQSRIFEKLFRADNVVKADTQGNGIGLYISKNTVDAWGGKLWFQSEEGKGTTFHFTVPRVMEKLGDEENGDATANTAKDSS